MLITTVDCSKTFSKDNWKVKLLLIDYYLLIQQTLTEKNGKRIQISIILDSLCYF